MKQPIRFRFGFGIALAAATFSSELAAQDDNQVAIHPSHVEYWWPAGTLADPFVVTRDNPQFFGTFPWNPNDWSEGDGLYSHTYQWSSIGVQATLFFHEFWNNPPNYKYVDDWLSLLRPAPGYREHPTALVWQTRTGKLVHGTFYKAYQAHNLNSTPNDFAMSENPTFFRLSDDVYVVPIVVTSWLRPGEYADHRAKAAAMIDFMPLEATSLWTFPDDSQGSTDPHGVEQPPDDIWTQCGIQLQVVINITCPTPQTYPSCVPDSCQARFETNAFQQQLRRRNCLLDAFSVQGSANPQADLDLVELQLQPIYLDYGSIPCADFNGSACPLESRVQVDVTPHIRTTAHELGHVLFQNAGHIGTSNDLMYGGANPGTQITSDPNWNCATARGYARAKSDNFRLYNSSVGRVPYDNPFSYPDPNAPVTVDMERACCEVGSQHVYEPVGICFATAGKIVSEEKCTECCLTSSPLDLQVVLSGQCGGTVLESPQCNEVCCDIDGNYGYGKNFICALFGGKSVDFINCELPP